MFILVQLYSSLGLKRCKKQQKEKISDQGRIKQLKARHIALLSYVLKRLQDRNKTNDLILNLTPENVTQHSRIE